MGHLVLKVWAIAERPHAQSLHRRRQPQRGVSAQEVGPDDLEIIFSILEDEMTLKTICGPCIYIYMYICMCIYIYIYVYVYIPVWDYSRILYMTACLWVNWS